MTLLLLHLATPDGGVLTGASRHSGNMVTPVTRSQLLWPVILNTVDRIGFHCQENSLHTVTAPRYITCWDIIKKYQ